MKKLGLEATREKATVVEIGNNVAIGKLNIFIRSFVRSSVRSFVRSFIQRGVLSRKNGDGNLSTMEEDRNA